MGRRDAWLLKADGMILRHEWPAGASEKEVLAELLELRDTVASLRCEQGALTDEVNALEHKLCRAEELLGVALEA